MCGYWVSVYRTVLTHVDMDRVVDQDTFWTGGCLTVSRRVLTVRIRMDRTVDQIDIGTEKPLSWCVVGSTGVGTRGFGSDCP